MKEFGEDPMLQKNRIEHSEGLMGPRADQYMGDDKGFGHGLHPTALSRCCNGSSDALRDIPK